jgi:hypothetical protein
MKDNIMEMDVMNMKQIVARAKACGINISVYTLRKAIMAKELPCRVLGKTYMITWDNFLRWIHCEQ